MKTVYDIIQLPLFASTKRCARCKQDKPLEAFDRASNQKSGYRPSCKECRRKPKLRIVAFQVCVKCGAEQPIENFHRQITSSTGHRKICKDCQYEVYGPRRRKNPTETRHRFSKPVVIPATKNCYACNQEKPIEEFAKDKYTWHGYKSRCKECDRVYRDTHKEEIRQYHHAHHRSNRAKLLAQSKQRYLRNRERVLARSRTYNNVNKEVRSLREKRRRENNPIRYRQYVSQRRARKRMASIGKVDYTHILKRDGRWCYICEQAILPTQKLEFDHVIPLIRGGAHSEENIRVSHLTCNRRKGSLMPDELTPFHRQGV